MLNWLILLILTGIAVVILFLLYTMQVLNRLSSEVLLSLRNQEDLLKLEEKNRLSIKSVLGELRAMETLYRASWQEGYGYNEPKPVDPSDSFTNDYASRGEQNSSPTNPIITTATTVMPTPARNATPPRMQRYSRPLEKITK